MKIDKDLIYLSFSRIFQVLLMLISLRITTTFLTPKEMGNYNLLLTILSFYNLVFLNPPGMYFSRHIIKWEQEKFLLNAFFIFFLWILFVSLLSIFISNFLYKILHYENNFNYILFVLYFVFAIIFSTVHRNMLYGLNMLQKRKDFMIFLLLTLSFKLLFSSLIVILICNNAIYWASGAILAEILLIYPIYKKFMDGNHFSFQKVKNKISLDGLYEILRFSIPIAVSVFLMWSQSSGYKIIIENKYGVAILGFMGVGFGIASSVFSVVESILSQYFTPLFYKKITNNEKQIAFEWNLLAEIIVPIYVLLFIFVLISAKFLLVILVHKTYYSAYIFTMFGAGIEFFRVMNNLLNLIVQANKNTKIAIFPYLYGAMFLLISIWLFNFNKNYYAIALLILISNFLIFVFFFKAIRKFVMIKFNIKKIVKTFIYTMPLSFFLFIKNINLIISLIMTIIVFLYIFCIGYLTIVKGKK